MIDSIKIIEEIKVSSRIAIISHIYPDGDAVGSSLALAMALESIGKTVDVYLADGVPCTYSFLHGAGAVLKEWNKSNYDIAIALDSGDIERLGSCIQIFNTAKIRLNIDHHITNANYGDYNYIEPDACSVGEIIYKIIKMFDITINKDIAECIYVSIATDTGGFRFSNTTSKCMQIAGDLIDYGINVNDISRKIFDATSLTKIKLMGLAVSSLELFSQDRIAVMFISSEQREDLNADFEEFDGIVNIARNIMGVEIAVFLLEKSPNEIKINFRSNNYVDVSEIAQKYSGGGHKRAAGCTISDISLYEAKKLILKDIIDAI